MTRRTIAGPISPDRGESRLTHLSDLMVEVEDKMLEANREANDLRQKVEAKHAAIERRNADTQKQNDLDALNIGAMQNEILDWEHTAAAAQAALDFARGKA